MSGSPRMEKEGRKSESRNKDLSFCSVSGWKKRNYAFYFEVYWCKKATRVNKYKTIIKNKEVICGMVSEDGDNYIVTDLFMENEMLQKKVTKISKQKWKK